MGIVSKLFGDDVSASRRTSPASDYIDLSDYQATEKAGEATAATYVKFADLRALDDLKHFASYVYDGNLLVIDFGKVQNDEILLRRLTNELRKLAADTGGDIAGLGDHHILLTPTGVKVDRRKVSTAATGEETEAPAPRMAPAPAPAPVAATPAPAPRTNGTTGRRMNGANR